MFRLQYKNGLLYAEVDIKNGDKTITINDVIIDTGAFHTILLHKFSPS